MPNSVKGDLRSHHGIGRRFVKTLLAVGMATNFLSNAFSDHLLADEFVPASKMLPASTQALISLPNTPKFIELWNQTQLGKLAMNDKLVPFWETQRQELLNRLSDAGWQLSLQAEDLEQLAAGQTSVAWIAREGAKGYSIALIIDIADRNTEAESFLKRIDKQFADKKSITKKWEHNGAKITQYLLESVTNEKRQIESNYVVHNGQLIVADDEATIKELLDAQSGQKQDSLAADELYKTAHARVEADGAPEVDYFVRPLGLAKLFRTIGGRTPKGSQDLLKLIEGQGFGAIECAIGHVHLSEAEYDIFHHGFIKLQRPVKKAVEILDFPNVENLIPPVWLSKDSATVMGFSWNIKDAFMKFEPIVDGYLDPDRPGTFSEILEGIRDDIQGPQIDIAKEVLPFLSNEFFISTEISKPITTDSKRSLVLLKLNDPDKKLNRVIDRYGQNEANGTPTDYDNGKYRIWSFKNEDEPEIELDFGGGSVSSGDDEEEIEEPLLDHWAISIVEGYFVFGSDAELIIDLIERIKANPETSEFLEQADVARVAQVIESASASTPVSAIQINRSDIAFEMQYELFREGQLNASRSIMASLLDRLLDPKTKNRDREQRIKGSDLPPYDTIRQYFMPSGNVVQTADDGWTVQSFVLRKEDAPKPAAE